jgi:FkbM family methyltransferase
MVAMKTYLSKGKKTQFLWHFPDNETHFIKVMENDPNPEYQYKVKRMIEDRKHLLNFDHVLDIGANVGLWTRWFSRHGAKTINCFEPMSGNVECLIENTKDLNGVSIHNCALGENEGTLTLYNSAKQKNSGAATIDTSKLSNSLDLVKQVVECKTLDSLNLSPTFVKIDVQGAEMMVLKGGQETFKKYRPGLVVECNDNGEILELLYSWGYEKIMNIGNDALMVAA